MPDLRELFLKDKIFAYPTEGVWGIGCNPFSELAVKKLIQLKNRDENKGIIVLAGNLAQIKALTEHLDSDIRIKMEDKWPGPHTLSLIHI